ncbi:MAG: HAD family hydrolase, partial [Verrucomicrobia bacterium]
LSRWHDAATVEAQLYKTEMSNLELFGYGIKAHALSSIETAIEITRGEITAEEIRAIIDLAREMLDHPVELLPGAAEVVPELARRYRLLLITKGDLRDQERKIRRSGLETCFEHIEILSEKTAPVYSRILSRHGIEPENFLMVGNSLKSDILPVLDLGGHAVHIPYRITWQHERAEPPTDPERTRRFHPIRRLADLPGLLARLHAPA